MGEAAQDKAEEPGFTFMFWVVFMFLDSWNPTPPSSRPSLEQLIHFSARQPCMAIARRVFI